MGHYFGVDVGLRTSSLCIIDEQGKVCLERDVASEIEAIADVIRGFDAHVGRCAGDGQPDAMADGRAASGHLYRTFLDIDKLVKTLAHDDAVCQLLMSAPGIGFVAALTCKAAVDDPRRFRRSKTVAAHFGLTLTPPVWRKEQPRPYIQGRRCRGLVSPVPGGQHHHEWPRSTFVSA